MSIQETLKKLNKLCESDTREDRREFFRIVDDIVDDDEYAAVLKVYPGVNNYDRNGGWIGNDYTSSM